MVWVLGPPKILHTRVIRYQFNWLPCSRTVRPQVGVYTVVATEIQDFAKARVTENLAGPVWKARIKSTKAAHHSITQIWTHLLMHHFCWGPQPATELDFQVGSELFDGGTPRLTKPPHDRTFWFFSISTASWHYASCKLNIEEMEFLIEDHARATIKFPSLTLL